MYGGGSKGLMGVVSGGVLQRGGKVTGVVPYAMVAAGGEKPIAGNNNTNNKTNESSSGCGEYGRVTLGGSHEAVNTVRPNSKPFFSFVLFFSSETN